MLPERTFKLLFKDIHGNKYVNDVPGENFIDAFERAKDWPWSTHWVQVCPKQMMVHVVLHDKVLESCRTKEQAELAYRYFVEVKGMNPNDLYLSFNAALV